MHGGKCSWIITCDLNIVIEALRKDGRVFTGQQCGLYHCCLELIPGGVTLNEIAHL